MRKITVVLPAYRAEQTLGKTIADMPAGVADELILVDDASPDQTVEVARRIGGINVFVHDTNRGYGGNQKTCYTEALRSGADVVVLLHPDYQYDPKALPLLVAPILSGDADLTFGSRFAGLSDPRAGGMPLFRYVGNRVTTVIENLLLGSRFTEMHSGMRAYTRRALLSLPFKSYSNDRAFDGQLLADAVTSGLRVVEVPIPTRYGGTSGSIAIWPSLRYVAGTIVWTARRASERGRRGKRNPVGMPPRAKGKIIAEGEPVAIGCFLCGDYRARRLEPGGEAAQCLRCGVVRSLAPPEEQAPSMLSEAEYAWMFARAAGYAVRADTMMVVGWSDPTLKGAAAQAGWSVVAGRGDAGAGFVAAVLAPFSLERLADPTAALRGVGKVLDPEGLLLAAVRGAAAAAPDATGMATAFTPRTLRATLAAGGFTMVEWARMPGRHGDAFVVARPSAGVTPGPADEDRDREPSDRERRDETIAP